MMMKRLTVLSRVLIIFLIGLALLVPSVGAAGKSFTDYHEKNFGFDEVSYLVEKDVIRGYGDGSFKPNREVNRAETAIMFQRALDLAVPANRTSFKDIAASSDFADAAAAVKEAGIFQGNSDGTFGPGDFLTREQMASVIVRAFGFKELSSFDVNFNDFHQVSPAHIKDVKILYQNGITNGKANGLYDPKGTVSRAEFSVFMYRALKLIEPVPHPGNLKISQTTLTTSAGTIAGNVSGGTKITYDLRNVSGQATITSGKLVVSEASTLTLTDIPSPINLVVENGSKQELTQGENQLLFADKISATGVNLSMIQDFMGNFTVGATLEDKQGNKQEVSIHFLVK